MIPPIFSPQGIDWVALEGGTEEAAWIVDRNRKIATISGFYDEILATYTALNARNQLFRVTPEVLSEIHFSALWFISLAGFAQKTLSNIHCRSKNHGLTVAPKTLLDNLYVPDKRKSFLERIANQPSGKEALNLIRFADWLKSEIDEIYPEESRSPERALIHVSMLLGGRVIGQGQNTGGNEAVLLVKQKISLGLREGSSAGETIEIQVTGTDAWEIYDKPSALALAVKIRIGGVVEIEFIGGGNNPDIKILSVADGYIFAVGEIKGRKDLSNLWESWMPQVVAHMDTWKKEFPGAHRIFIGTLINDQMINGESGRGTPRKGLRDLHDDGDLAAAFNIAKIIEGDCRAIAHFEEFLEYIRQVVKMLKPDTLEEIDAATAQDLRLLAC